MASGYGTDIMVGDDMTTMVGDDMTTMVGDDMTTMVGNDMTTMVGDDMTTVIGDDMTTMVGDDMTTVIGDDMTTMVGDDMTTMIGYDMTTMVGDDMITMIGDDMTTMIGDDMTTMIGDDMTTMVTDVNTVTASSQTGQSLAVTHSTPHPSPDSTQLRSDAADAVDILISDTSDAKTKGYGPPLIESRPIAAMPVSPHSPLYSMEHRPRGLAVIFVYEKFVLGGPPRRSCGSHDARICRQCFTHLGFQVPEPHRDLRKKDFLLALENLGKLDHSKYDALVVVFMSHGGVNEKTNKEFIWTYDDKVDTAELWKNFDAAKCPSLAGKPKMFFIQACRGEDTDKGVTLKPKKKGLSVETDSLTPKNIDQEYTIPVYADMLMMWASYSNMYAFKSGNNGINGSVFLHYLTKVLVEDSHKDDLATMLLRVTREVAVHFQSFVPNNYILHDNKQVPQSVSTLLRKVYFFDNNV